MTEDTGDALAEAPPVELRIRNPAFTADGRIDCELLHPRFGWIPFTADPEDDEPHGREIHAQALAMGPAPWSPPPPDLEALAAEARAHRDALLAACDWTQVADAPVDRAAWAAYRQTLRDLPEQAGFPTGIAWPEPPVA
ncbi:hypothetical protein RSWS8N_00475 [Cereibacter sphaeroides WS8N]|uniref:tail fiber assembly protein n=1 Tax=Cereibacter sphaeroides TaxID=1063 RepID=UPI00020DF423|nr:tail fiber assembly protein [Cereibacter sphaeroides]EGJ20507.1 hypothetical protein RSWS8N_00475 [Cereibacter sphaeroides WS8N]